MTKTSQMNKIKVWISAARLRTLPLSLSGIIVGSAAGLRSIFDVKLASNETGIQNYTQGDIWTSSIFWLAIFTTLGFQILSNFANDYGDGIKGTDNADRVGPARALQSGLLTARELKRGMIVTAALTLLLASMLIFAAFGNENFLLSFLFFNLGIAAIIAAVKYTVGKSAYGYRAMGDIFVFIFFGIVGVMGCYFLFTQSLGALIVLPAVTIGLLSVAVLNLNNMRDRMNDTKVNKITLAVMMGAEKIKHYHAFLILTSFICAVIFLWTKSGNWIIWTPLIAFGPILVNLITVYTNRDPKKLDPELKKVALSTFLFSILFVVSSYYWN